MSIDSGATYRLGANDAIGSLQGKGDVDLSSYMLASGGNNLSTTFEGVIAGSGSFEKYGSGVFSLLGANVYTGSTTINEGKLLVGGSLSDVTSLYVAVGGTYELSADDTIGSITGGGKVVLNDSNLSVGGSNNVLDFPDDQGESITGVDDIVLNENNFIADGGNGDFEFSGDISGDGGFTKLGEGTLTLTGQNSYSGYTYISDGALRVAGSGSLGDSTVVNVYGGARYELDNDDQIAVLSGVGSVELGSHRLTLSSPIDSDFRGVLSGSGGITKSGTGRHWARTRIRVRR